MTRRRLALFEWSLPALGALPIVLAIGALGGPPTTTHDSRPAIATVGASLRAQHLSDSLLHGIVELAPFRLSRRAAVAYQLGRPDLAPDAALPPKPVLSLSGIILGRKPAALIEGVPGRDGSTLLQLGDTVAGLRLRSIANDRVVITGMDTTWTLRVREIWNQ